MPSLLYSSKLGTEGNSLNLIKKKKKAIYRNTLANIILNHKVLNASPQIKKQSQTKKPKASIIITITTVLGVPDSITWQQGEGLEKKFIICTQMILYHRKPERNYRKQAQDIMVGDGWGNRWTVFVCSSYNHKIKF